MDQTHSFFQAIQNGEQADVAARLTANPALATARNANGVSAVLWAFYTGESEIADRLIAQAGPLDIFEAAAAGRTADVTHLLAADPNLVNAVSPDGFSPLGLAAFFGRPEVAALLLGRGATVNQVSQNRMQVMPLHSAVAARHLEISEVLLAAGAAVNAVQADDFTPLQEAAQNGDLAMAHLLLRYGADPQARKSDNQTALDVALEHHQTDLVALLAPLTSAASAP